MVWHIAQAEPGKDAKACTSLQRLRYDWYYPVYPEERIMRNRPVRVFTPMFRNYIFVRKGANQDWYRLQRAPGIRVAHSLLPLNGRYATITDEEMARIREKAKALNEQELAPVEPPKFKAGDEVRIEVGSFAELLAKIEELDNVARKARLVTYLLGRQVTITAPTDALTACIA